MNNNFQFFELTNGGVLYAKMKDIVSYGQKDDISCQFFITLSNGKEYTITDESYEKLFNK